jgi:hypothetical protein
VIEGCLLPRFYRRTGLGRRPQAPGAMPEGLRGRKGRFAEVAGGRAYFTVCDIRMRQPARRTLR